MKRINLFGFLLISAALCSSALAQAEACGATEYQCKVDAYTLAIDKDAGNAEAYYNRAIAYQGLDIYDKAAVDLDKYIASRPTNAEYLADGYNARALSKKKMGDFEGSISDYNAAIKLAPKNARFLANRGTAYSDKGNFQLALLDLNGALLADPNNRSARLQRSIAYWKKKDNVNALKDVGFLLQTDRNDAEAYYQRGLIYRDQARYDEAVADFTKYVSMDLTNHSYWADGYLERGKIRAKRGDLEGSLADLDKAASLKPEAAEIYRARAITYRKMNKPVLAEADEQRAKDKN